MGPINKAVRNCFALVFRNSASVGKEPAEVRVHGGRSATAHLSKLRKTQARIQKDDPIGSLATIFLITVKIVAAILPFVSVRRRGNAANDDRCCEHSDHKGVAF